MTDPEEGAESSEDAPDTISQTLSPEALDALVSALALKDEARTGWELRGVSEPESVAAHSWAVAYLCLVLGDAFRTEFPDLDVDRAIRLAVVHDLPEAETGDVPTRADSTASTPPADATEAEEERAMNRLADPLPTDVRETWVAYESRDTPEAIVVKECDLLELCLQALAYERADRYDPDAGEPDAFVEYDALDEFFATAEPRLQTDLGRRLFDRIRHRYETARESGR